MGKTYRLCGKFGVLMCNDGSECLEIVEMRGWFQDSLLKRWNINIFLSVQVVGP